MKTYTISISDGEKEISIRCDIPKEVPEERVKDALIDAALTLYEK